jgi:hypothetical protein
MASPAEDNKYCLQQVSDLRRKYPGSKSSWKRGTITWTGEIKPGPICDSYTVRISWRGRSARPVVQVIRPTLQLAEGRLSLPHIFPGDGLCLHYPGEWTRDMSIARTIIPWTSEWLFFYELWLLTGEWQGGGHEPGSDVPKRVEREPSEAGKESARR